MHYNKSFKKVYKRNPKKEPPLPPTLQVLATLPIRQTQANVGKVGNIKNVGNYKRDVFLNGSHTISL